jgi:hypothetical protein
MHCTSLHGHAACRAVPPMSRTVGRAAGPWAVWKYMPPAHGLFERVCVCEPGRGRGPSPLTSGLSLLCHVARRGRGHHRRRYPSVPLFGGLGNLLAAFSLFVWLVADGWC